MKNNDASCLTALPPDRYGHTPLCQKKRLQVQLLRAHACGASDVAEFLAAFIAAGNDMALVKAQATYLAKTHAKHHREATEELRARVEAAASKRTERRGDKRVTQNKRLKKPIQ